MVRPHQALPPSPAQVETEQWRCDRLREVVAHLSPQSLAGGAVVESHACYLPISPDGIPAIGVVPGVTGVYMATGNSCWGILTGPITGRFLAAMIVRDHHADLLAGHVQPEQEELAAGRKLLNDPRFREFDPARFVVAETTNPGSTIRVTKKPSS